jgi:hypothetical protein
MHCTVYDMLHCFCKIYIIFTYHRIGLENCAGQPLEVGWKVGGGTSVKEQKACKTNKQEKK